MDAIQRLQHKICELLLSVDVAGMEDLTAWLAETDFFTAPASTRYHGSREGGLALHSYRVYEILNYKREMVPELADRSIVITGLLHDVCKIGVYSRTWKNVKIYCEEGSRQDEGGRFDWQSQPGYAFEDPLPLGHGAKSVHLIQEHISLTDMEVAMILHHMAAFPGGDAARDFTAAARVWPAVALLHTADLEATHCIEERNKSWKAPVK